MSDFTQKIQEQLVQLKSGTDVTIILMSGREISGIVVDSSLDYIELKQDGRSRTMTVSLNMIGALEFPDETYPTPATEPPNFFPLERRPVLAPPHIGLPQVSPVFSGFSKTSVEPEVRGKLIEIEALFNGKIQGSRIEVLTPDLKAPAEELKSDRKNAPMWGSIRQKYENAARIRELGSKFGRIQAIIADLKELIEKLPMVSSLRRHLAYFHLLAGSTQEALKTYKEAGFLSESAHDWHNVAALAIEMNNFVLACYALEQVFQQKSVDDSSDAWYVYVGLLHKYGDYALLGRFYDTGRRSLSQTEEQRLLETCLYILKCTGKETIALDIVRRWQGGIAPGVLVQETLKHFAGRLSVSYQQAASELEAARQQLISVLKAAQQIAAELQTASDEGKQAQLQASSQQLQGYIYTYKIGRNYGFLNGSDGGNYFFHHNAVSDEELLERIEALQETFLRTDEQIPVIFEIAQGPKGPLAVGVSLYRTVDEIFGMAYDYAEEGEYAKAVTQIRRVLALDPQYPGAQQLYEKWRDYAQTARVAVFPRGSNPYARAKRVLLIEKDLERAAELFETAISQNDNTEGAVKDLAVLLGRLGRSQQAIQILEDNRKNITDQQSVDNLLIDVYQKAGQYEQAITLLEKNVKNAPTKERRAHLLWQMANCYLRQEDYKNAECLFREVVELGFDTKAAQRNIALCLIKQQRHEDAEQILNKILDTSPDAQAAELFEAIAKARATGEAAQLDQIITETTLSDFSTEMSGFTRFFLERCNYEGVPPTLRAEGRKFTRTDVHRLEELATQLGTRRPRERAEYYLSAAKIISTLSEWDDPNQLYKYLCRSFASRGDASIVENRPLDAAREWYCEALSVYDGDRSHAGDEQDAVNALVRYLYATLGVGYVPMKPHIPAIDETLEEILRLHPQREKVFDEIAYLIIRSRYAAHHILNRLYGKSSPQAMALQYLKSCGVTVPGSAMRQEEFVRLWNELLRKRFDEARTISTELRFIAKVELTTASVDSSLRSIGRIKELGDHYLFDLDQHRIGQLQRILETVLDLSKQLAFEEQERFCTQIGTRCQDLIREIEESPTKLSVEGIYPIVETIQKKTRDLLEEIYASSVPQLTLRLPEDLESYAPDTSLKIEVQIVIANRMGCSPAESLELVVQEDGEFFTVGVQEIKLDGSLRGGEQKIMRVPLRVTEQAKQSEAFSLPVYAQYRKRSGETQRTSVENFSIRLYSADQFERIENPYAAYAKGGAVENREMFYGRAELITNVASVIREARFYSKAVVIYGQKRAGKTSILHHLKTALSMYPDLLILDVGNIGSLLDEKSSIPLLYQILWRMLRALEYAIEDESDKGRETLQLSFPSNREFYEHPTPLTLFHDIFEDFKRRTAKTSGWQGVRVVLLIDEFSYIYGQIMNGRVSREFMQNWKALLQDNFFSVVLVGQDMMPRFKQEFPNEFGTTQDERVSYLKYEDAVKLIDEPLQIGGRHGESRYRENAIRRIVDLTAGSPFYIQIICNRLVEYMNRKRARLVTEADVEQVKSELLRGTNPLDWPDFDNLISSGDIAPDAISTEDAKQVLMTIAANSRTGPCSRNSIACETRDSVDAILKDLVDRDVVEWEQGQYYRIRVGLFKEWLLARQ